MTDQALVLIVDDDAAVSFALQQGVEAAGYLVQVAADAKAAKRKIKKERPDLVITDVQMPGDSGLDLLRELQKTYPTLPVVVMTAHGTMETAIDAVKSGAFDYLVKPLDLDKVYDVIKRVCDQPAVAASADPDQEQDAMSAIVGQTPAMQEVYKRIAAAAATDMGVLITGPTGAGKELVARALHQHSTRSQKAFVAVNCGALPGHLVESELFGHEAGAFTDAKEQKIGRIEAANGGTLLLDEVGELSTQTQVKLLRFLEDQTFARVGGDQDIQVDVRVIAATNRNLSKMTDNGEFREDLNYRLRVVHIELPPLIDRLDDLPLLVKHILGRVAERLDKRLQLTDDAMEAIRGYHWPGNVRELKHCLEEAAVMASGGQISAADLSITPSAQAPDKQLAAAVKAETSKLIAQKDELLHQHIIDAVEAAMIEEALAQTQGNQLRAAELLGINRITLKKRMDALLGN